MKQILDSGKMKVWSKIRCKYCECLFKYQFEDVVTNRQDRDSRGDLKTRPAYVECVECGKQLLHSESMIVND